MGLVSLSSLPYPDNNYHKPHLENRGEFNEEGIHPAPAIEAGNGRVGTDIFLYVNEGSLFGE